MLVICAVASIEVVQQALPRSSAMLLGSVMIRSAAARGETRGVSIQLSDRRPWPAS